MCNYQKYDGLVPLCTYLTTQNLMLRRYSTFPRRNRKIALKAMGFCQILRQKLAVGSRLFDDAMNSTAAEPDAPLS